jgi:hemerythrin-like domain-containing protein
VSQPVRIQPPSGASREAEGFEPFEMLHACHERVHRMLALLNRLREHVRTNGADEQARQAARDVMRYFDQAAPEHHRDEELHVFPPLLEQGDPTTVAVVARLQQDHLQMESRWNGARAVLDAVASGEVQVLGQQQDAALEAFAGLYGEHIEAEERIAYPAARALLPAERMAAMRGDMMARRGLQ